MSKTPEVPSDTSSSESLSGLLRGAWAHGGVEVEAAKRRAIARLVGPDLSCPARVGRFEIIEELGRGGQGIVYAATDPELGRTVALKIVARPAYAARDGGDDRLRREAQTLARLKHPNIAAVYEIGPADAGQGGAYVAMELVDGEELLRWCDRSQPRLDRLLPVFVAVAHGLQAAHDAGVVHQDVKPANILVSAGDRAKLVDFGLSAVVDGSPGTKPGVGTPRYMAPEQHRQVATPQSDQFGLCATLYHALYGDPPYRGGSAESMVRAKEVGDVALPRKSSQLRQRIPRWLRAILMRGLSPDPTHRFASLEALATALERGHGRRRRLAYAASAVVLAMGTGAIGWTLNAPADCETTSNAMHDAWSDDVRSRVHAALVGTSVPYAEQSATSVRGRLDAYATDWALAHDRTCGRADPRIDGCLAYGAERLRVLAALFVASAPSMIERAVEAADALPPPAACLTRVPSPPIPSSVAHDLARADAFVVAGQPAEARRVIEGMLAALRAESSTASLGPALWRLAVLDRTDRRLKEAERDLLEALAAAERSEDPVLAATIAVELVAVVIDRENDPLSQGDANTMGLVIASIEVARAKIEQVTAAAELTSELDLLYARALQISGEHVSARDAFAAVLEERLQRLGTHHEQTAQARIAVASQLLIVGAPEAARAELEALEVAWRHSRGEGHPAVARVAANLAIAEEDRGSLDRALELHLRALAGFQRALGPEHPLVIKATTNVGNCHLVRGEARDAIAWLEPAAVRLLDADPDHVLDTVATHLARAFAEVEAFEQALLWHHHAQTSARTQSKAAQAFAAAWQARTLVQAGHAEQALQEVIRARTELEAAGAPGGYLAIPRWIEAEALLALERHAEAVVALEEAFAHAPRGSLPLQLAELEFALGRALAPRDPQRAMTLVQSAVDAFDRVAPAHPRRDTIVTWRDHAWK